MSAAVLTAKDEALARRVAQIVIAARPAPVLPRTEAIAYVKLASDSAFDRWTAKWRVRPCDRGRYARGHLDRALAREATVRKTVKRRAADASIEPRAHAA